MGKRSRRRPEPAAAARTATPPPPRRHPGRPRPEDRPKPPWHPVPLVELCVLVGIVLLLLGAFNYDEDRGRILLVFGMALGSIGGLDTALREHFAGYKSHTTVIAALPGVLAAAALFFARVPWIAVIAGAVAVFAAAFWWLRRAFMRREIQSIVPIVSSDAISRYITALLNANGPEPIQSSSLNSFCGLNSSLSRRDHPKMPIASTIRKR